MSPTYWTAGWDYLDGDCGDLPGKFETEELAVAAGEDWVTEAEAQMREDNIDDEASYFVVRHMVQADGGEVVFDQDGKQLYVVGVDA